MRFHWAFLVAMLSFAPSVARSQAPDDRYVQVYALLEEADKLNSAGQAREAVTKYLEAQVAIKGLQNNYPEWNAKLVAFRLEYISSKLEPLTKKVAAGPAPSNTNSPAEAASPAQTL